MIESIDLLWLRYETDNQTLNCCKWQILLIFIYSIAYHIISIAKKTFLILKIPLETILGAPEIFILNDESVVPSNGCRVMIVSGRVCIFSGQPAFASISTMGQVIFVICSIYFKMLRNFPD